MVFMRADPQMRPLLLTRDMAESPAQFDLQKMLTEHQRRKRYHPRDARGQFVRA